MMTLLSGHSLTAKNRFQPESMNLTLEERNSSATITLGPEAPEIGVKDWIRDDTEPGKGVVWRVKTVSESVETQTRTITLEHAIMSLKDQIIFGQIQPKDITGSDSAKKCTAKQALNFILGKQSDWKLGSVAQNPSNPYSFNGDTLFSALETVTKSLEDVQWEYDFDSYPFTLNIRAVPEGFQSEMRMSRNITTLRRQVDRSRMYTRFYPVGKDNLTLGGGHYVQKNTSVYGVICKTETDQTLETTAELEAWANERLARHAEPAVTITISGQDLSAATGEALDKIRVGKNCRVPLPEFGGETILERVTKITWGDKIRKPGDFTVTLANSQEDVATIVNRIQEAAASGRSGGGRYGAKKNEEDHAWIEDTTDHVSIIAEAVGGKDANGNPNWSRVSQLTVDGNGIDARVTKTEGGLVTARSQIKQTEDSISQVVTAIGKDGKVTAASIVTAINNDKSEIRLNADRIYLTGTTKINDVMTAVGGQVVFKGNVTFANRSGSVSSAASIESGNAKVQKLTLLSGTSSYGVDYATLGTMIKTAALRSSGNVLRLTRFDGTYLDFSRAITSWSASGGNGMVTVKAQPQNQSHAVELQINGAETITTNEDYTFRVYYYDDDAEEWKQTGANKTVGVSVFPNTKNLYCSDKSTGGGVTTYTFTYTSASSSDFLKGSSYKFHHNSGYT